jgi:23S rRNA (uracil1939-C5)-methyltransferase
MSKRKRQHKPLPTETFAASVRALSHEGRGIATVNERTTFISNALPDEEVNFIYTHLSSRYAEGKAEEIIKASPDRVTPQCVYFGLCGGCSLQHMSHQAQLALKQNTLQEHLQHFAKSEPQTWLPPLTGPEYAYRHKARLGIRYVAKKSSVLIGFREQQSRYLADMSSCEVLAAPVGHLIAPLRELLMQLDAKEQLAQIEVAVGENATALLLRNLVELSASDRALLTAFATEHQLWLFLQPNKPKPLEKLWPLDNEEFLQYEQPHYNLTFWFHPTDFTQVNPAINRDMVQKALALLDLQPTDSVLDLFCGLGNFTLPISRFVKHVVGVEGSDEMVQRASMNAERNQISNVEFHAADLTKPQNAPWVKQRYNKLLLDPPRSGALEILPLLNDWQPAKIVYVSCNPATLARDIGEMLQYGYQLIATGIMDMFPQTNHVESIALLERVK